MKNFINTLIYASVLCLACTGAVIANETGTKDTDTAKMSGNVGDSKKMAEELKDANDTVSAAALVIQEFKANADADAKTIMNQAKAVLIVPHYSRAALGVGGAGGQGALVVNHNGNWSGPAFYTIGSASLGLQAGIEKGAIAFFIMSDKALKNYRDNNNFSLDADAGLTVINFSKRGQASTDKGVDVIAWSDTKGLYGDLAVGVTDVSRDDDANHAYYRQKVDASAIINGTMKNPNAKNPLDSELNGMQTSERNDAGMNSGT